MAAVTKRPAASAAASAQSAQPKQSQPQQKQQPLSSVATEGAIPGLNIATGFAIWLLITSVVPVVLSSALLSSPDGQADAQADAQAASIPNALGFALLFFNNLNILIAFCEIALGIHIRWIQQDYRNLKEMYRGVEYKAAFAYLTMPLSITTLFDSKRWAIMWSTYSLWDPSYQNQESFGFFVDVGNGWSTILPCLLWNAAIIVPHQLNSILGQQHAWLAVGVIGCCSYWQVLYGTIIYLLSFIFNARHKGKPLAEVLGFVGFANGIWFVFPIFGIYAAVIILRDQDIVDVFRR